MNLQILFEKIYEDPKVISEYIKIKEKDKTSHEAYATHDMSHVSRVITYSEKIAKLLALDSEKIAEIKIAALLHDIGCAISGKNGHAEKSYEWAKKYLTNFDIDNEIRNSILIAIKEHSGNASNLCGKIVAFSDKLDINKDRILPLGLKINGNREYAHLLSVNMEIKNKCLFVKFTSDGELNLKEVNDYYFTSKVFESIKDLANYFNLSYSVLIDEMAWIL